MACASCSVISVWARVGAGVIATIIAAIAKATVEDRFVADATALMGGSSLWGSISACGCRNQARHSDGGGDSWARLHFLSRRSMWWLLNRALVRHNLP